MSNRPVFPTGEIRLQLSHRRLPRRQQLETDLKIERQWRQTLENDLDREKDSVAQLGSEAMQISALKKVKSPAQSTARLAWVSLLDRCLCFVLRPGVPSPPG